MSEYYFNTDKHMHFAFRIGLKRLNILLKYFLREKYEFYRSRNKLLRYGNYYAKF